MKRYVIPIVIVFVLTVGVVVGCDGLPSSEPEASNYEQRIAELEKQVQELSNKNGLQPRIIEKDIEYPNGYLLPFYLKVGDRVEGEVSFTYRPETPSSGVEAEVKDPYENIVVDTRQLLFQGGRVRDKFQGIVLGQPWRFSFIASTDGEYKLGVYFKTTSLSFEDLKPVVHMKIVHYTGN